jgi:ATP-dependent phosphofructokinase / diphosphate-dependent phosphofructokinase
LRKKKENSLKRQVGLNRSVDARPPGSGYCPAFYVPFYQNTASAFSLVYISSSLRNDHKTQLLIMRIGILTAGGDCPGLNAAIRAVVRRAHADGSEVLGIRNGYLGLFENDVVPLTRTTVIGILPRGGTILGTSRFNPMKDEQCFSRVMENYQTHRLDGLIVVGGEGSLSAARDLWQNHHLPLLGIPKTIDNDVCGTDFTFGFDTAVSIVTDAIDRLHSTAESHHRVMVVEVMGRHTGWIAAYGGIAGGADVVLVPEHPFRISRVCDLLGNRKTEGRAFSIVVVAEDAHPHPDELFLTEEQYNTIYRHNRLGGIGEALAAEIERCTGIQTRITKLGYVQRGGSPTAFDRILATRFGIKAYEMLRAGQWGQMTALRGNRIVGVPLVDAVGDLKRLDEEIYRIAEVFFG